MEEIIQGFSTMTTQYFNMISRALKLFFNDINLYGVSLGWWFLGFSLIMLIFGGLFGRG